MKLLVTGSTGLVGSACVEFFLSKGWEVMGIDANMRSYFFGTPRKEVSIDIDIRNKIDIDDLFKENKFDAIIHAAAQPSHDWAKNEPLTDFDINARGTLILLEATRQYCPEAVFVYVSTDKVYGENLPNHRLVREIDGLDFAGKRSLFGCSKAAADLYVQEYGNYFGMKTVCFRPGCITGKAHEGAEYHGFLAYVAKCVKENKPYTIFADTIRDQIHAKDLANAFWHFIQNPKSGEVYNIGGGPYRAISVKQAISECEYRIGNVIEVKEGEMRPGDRLYDVHDVSKFKSDYPEWDYGYTLADILDELCEK